ncbi:Bud-site selection protein [Durotheca rogersii]|uniref:Bud-site selection protein n=1 Tax=Durotheca rogersii TaxID=419775 RepID=UPI00222062FD|nr:Bud-site selection protein [Durotheca rogersii]KAI5866310.1 Bud-site selection protein [Durotheca rogersii]
MPLKRKRSYEPPLEEKLTRWQKELARGMKKAKTFERRRQSKRQREASAAQDAAKVARLEREVAVLRSLDLAKAARAHLASALLRVRGVAEAGSGLPQLEPPPPVGAGLTEEERAALHNVTSALCSRKEVRDVIEAAIAGTCAALGVPAPGKKGKGKEKGKNNDGEGGGSGGAKRWDVARKGEEDKDRGDERKGGRTEKEEKEEKKEKKNIQPLDSEEELKEPELVLLRRKPDRAAEGEEELESAAEEESPDDNEAFHESADSDAEERAFSRYAEFVAGTSSDEGESEDDESSGGEESGAAAESRTKSIRKRIAADAVSASSSAPSDGEAPTDHLDSSSASGSPARPAAKKARTTDKAPRGGGKISAGASAFLPTLMGGYVSGSESSASSIDVAPAAARRNRRGQRARRAIWEKKYKDKARHLQAPQPAAARDQGWDPRRGAVGADDAGQPWKKGVRNPFAPPPPQQVHPDRHSTMQRAPRQPWSAQRGPEAGGRGGGGEREGGDHNARPGARDSHSHARPPRAPAAAPPKRDDTGPLHPSWAAAKKAKEEGQKVAFQGKKVVFD